MEPTCIYTSPADPALQLTVSRTASPQTVALLQQTVYGTNGPQYSHTGQEAKIARLRGAYFFELWAGAQLVGTCCLIARELQTPAGNVTGFYGRYLAVAAGQRGRGYGRLLTEQAVSYIEQVAPRPHLLYAYVEEANVRSLQLFKQTALSLTQLEALAFGRLYPVLDPRFGQLAPEELGVMQAQLAAAYQGYSLLHFEYLYDEQHYFVLRENGEIIAGVQANPVRWRIEAMPGLSGKLLLHVLPHLPVLKRLINPANFTFAALEAVYVQPGREPELLKLLESVLAHFGYTSALLMLDVNAPLHKWLKASGQLGLLQSLKKTVYTQVLVKLNGLTEQQVKQLPMQPLYTSAFDYT